MSFKFGGLEELGEKMCIIGELGKLLLEEIPLEETPPGYGRAPYNSFDRTENTMAEAKKCVRLKRRRVVLTLARDCAVPCWVRRAQAAWSTRNSRFRCSPPTVAPG